MRARVTLASLFFSILGATALLVPTGSYAACTNPCMCGYGCYSGCQCPGTNGCRWCAMPSIEKLEVNATPPAATSDQNPYGSIAPSIAVNSYSLDRLIRRVATGQCARNKFRLKIVDEGNTLKLEEAFLGDVSVQEERLAFKTGSEE